MAGSVIAMVSLAYRTLDFEPFYHEGDYQGCAVMNYSDKDVPFTRITEHKHFAPQKNQGEGAPRQTICFREFSRSCTPDDIPYYPVRLVQDKTLLANYKRRAEQEDKVSFLGRLGTYRYLDMDVTIREALNGARQTLESLAQGQSPPSFFVEI